MYVCIHTHIHNTHRYGYVCTYLRLHKYFTSPAKGIGEFNSPYFTNSHVNQNPKSDTLIRQFYPVFQELFNSIDFEARSKYRKEDLMPMLISVLAIHHMII